MTKHNYNYPKECFSINETTTKNAKAEYERKCDKWYAMQELLYPDYYKLDLRERMKAREVINKTIGYRI